MDVSRVAGLPNYSSVVAVPARRQEGSRAPAMGAMPAPQLPADVRATPPVKRVYDGEYLQAERTRVFRASPESLRSRLFDGEPGTIVYESAYGANDTRSPGAQYRANAADRLLAESGRGQFIDERV